MSKGYRDYCFTINNFTLDDLEWLKQPIFKYIVAGHEIGENETPHLQGYCCFKDQKTLGALKKIHPKAHWEKRMGTQQQAIDYCKKDGIFDEYGTPPMSQKEKGEKGREWWDQQVNNYAKGNFDEVDTECLVKHGNGLRNAAMLRRPKPPNKLDDDTRHRWYYGPTRTGKSTTAREEFPDAYIKDPKTVWWDGYMGQEVVIIDDFDVYQKAQGGDMKRWLDIWKCQAQVKGGYMEIRPKLVIVTSNYHPREIWDDAQTLEPILARVNITHFDKLV